MTLLNNFLDTPIFNTSIQIDLCIRQCHFTYMLYIIRNEGVVLFLYEKLFL